MRVCNPFLAAAMIAIISIPAIAQPTASPTSRPEEHKSPATQPIVTIDLSTPRATLDTLHRASVAADLDGAFLTIDPRLQPVYGTLLGAQRRLRDRVATLATLVERTVGRSQAGAVRRIMDEMRPPSPLAGAVRSGSVDWSLVAVAVRDDRARVTVDDRPLSMTLLRIDGKWYISPWAEDAPDIEKLKTNVRISAEIVERLADRLGEMERRVRAGEVSAGNFQAVFEATTSGSSAGRPGK
jgi:hypothetical protein